MADQTAPRPDPEDYTDALFRLSLGYRYHYTDSEQRELLTKGVAFGLDFRHPGLAWMRLRDVDVLLHRVQ